MTEQVTEERAGTEEAPRCRWGAQTEHPCPREATQTSWVDRGGVPTICAEHAVVSELGKEEDELLEAQHYLDKWLARARKRGAGGVLIGALERALEEVLQGQRDFHRRLEGAVAVANSYKDDSTKGHQ